jgi:phosphoglycolate phosphatase
MLYLFDIDGTLIHCGGAGRRALEQACAPFLGEAALTNIRLDGMTDPLILAEAFTARLGRGPSPQESAEVAARYRLLLEAETRPEGTVAKLPHVDQTLAALKQRGALLGLATGNWSAGARIKLERVGLWSQFLLGGYGSDSAERAELVRVARCRGEQHLGRALHRDEVFVIGDTPRDIAAAHAAGTRSVGVATGAYSVAELQEHGADVACADLSEWLACWSP